MLQRMRRYHGCKKEYSAFWFMEFQERGSIHFHLFTTHKFPKEWIAKSWYQVVGSEDKRHLFAGTRIESIRSGRHGICAYASKYAAKSTQKKVPVEFGWVGRFWGVSNNGGITSAEMFLSAYSASFKSVLRRVKCLEKTLEDGISRKQIKDISKKNCPARVFFVRDNWLLPIIRMQITMLNVSSSVYQHGYIWPMPELVASIETKEDDEWFQAIQKEDLAVHLGISHLAMQQG